MLFVSTGNAEMTDVFKCRKTGTQCCAPKSLIRDVLDSKSPQGSSSLSNNRNDTYPVPFKPHYSPQLSTNQIGKTRCQMFLMGDRVITVQGGSIFINEEKLKFDVN